MSWEKLIESGNLSLARGFYDEARRRYMEALESARAYGQGDPLWADNHRGLARALLGMGKNDEAVQAATIALSTDESYWGTECEKIAEDSLVLGDALRALGDFERAMPTYQRVLTIYNREYGDAHPATVEVLSRLVVTHLQSGSEFGFEQIHTRAFTAYQQLNPGGMWANFLHLRDLAVAMVAAGKESDLENLLKREAHTLRKLVGPNHREVAEILKIQSELLKKASAPLAAWQTATRAQSIERADSLPLVFGDERTYPFKPDEIGYVIEKLMSVAMIDRTAPLPLQNGWWVSQRPQLQGELPFSLRYSDDKDRQVKNAELRLTVRLSPIADKTLVNFQWHLFNSSSAAQAKEIIKYTLNQFDQTLLIMPRSASSVASMSSASLFQIGTGNFWPTPQQYNESIQNPAAAFSDEELKKTTAEVNQLGLPKPLSGAFATVYRMQGAGGDWAVKCFSQPVADDHEHRYQTIAMDLHKANLPYFLSFDYLKSGIKVDNQWFPTVKMNWGDGAPISVFLVDHLFEPDRLAGLAASFERMVSSLRQSGIAHGDLQHGNILVAKDDHLLLVDYDGMFTPGMAGWKSSELGHRNYQHPRRNESHFNADLDNFSALVIFVSIFCLSKDYHLWSLLQGGDDCLLFRSVDFGGPSASQAFQILQRHERDDVRRACDYLRQACQTPFDEVPPLSALLTVLAE
jgi:tetratricopeptide (TPR) repeat protein